MAAAGAFGYDAGRGYAAALGRLGAVVTRGVGARSRSGGPPRLVESPAGVIYAPGGARLGASAAARRYSHAWAASPVPVVVSLESDEGAGFVVSAAELEGVRGVSALELNLASVNAATGAPFGHVPAETGQIVREVRRVCQLPVLAKLPADSPDPELVLDVCAAAGAAGVVLACGLPVAGGTLVGPATFPLVLALVRRLAPGAPLPVVACGGVATADQAMAYLRAGASAVQIGSAHLANPHVSAAVAEALARQGRQAAVHVGGGAWEPHHCHAERSEASDSLPTCLGRAT
jgi:dihydroorotate dehydrogenase (NAD+) catalytic subunit